MEDKVLGPEFWAKIEESAPYAYQAFLVWVDNYKKTVNWDVLFNNSVTMTTREIKFHSLPGYMQLGIVLKFANENHTEVDIYFGPDIEIREIFETIEHKGI